MIRLLSFPILMVCTAFSLRAGAAQQWNTIEIAKGLTIGAGEIRSIALPSAMKVSKLFVQAESAGRENALFDVVVNGDIKGTILTPAADPTYVVTVAETTGSVELRSISGGAFRIFRIMAVVNTESRVPGTGLLPGHNDLTRYAQEAIALIRVLEQGATPNEQLRYLLPVKAAAGRLYAIAAARGSQSKLSLQSAVELIGAIDSSKVYLDILMERNGSFDCIVTLLTLRANLDALVD